jgi:hypothetical protein
MLVQPPSGTTATSMALTTPAIGAATGTSVTLGTNGGTGGSVVLNGSSSGSATINTSSSGVLALPSGTTATNMALTTPSIAGTSTTGVTGSGKVVLDTSPTFTTGETSPAIKLTNTTNQIVSGASTNLTTVNLPASSGAVTVTMPNVTGTVPVMIASGAQALGTPTVSQGTCSNAITATATGALASDRIVASPAVDPSGVSGYAPSTTGSLYVIAFATTDTVSFKVCYNGSLASLAAAALTMNWAVER